MSDKTPEQAFAEALAAFQADMPDVEKQATGQAGTRTTKYADLAHVTEQAYPKLAEQGLAFTASPTLLDDGRFVLRYALTHKDGHREGGLFPLPDSGNSQQIGSAITYARRYSLLAVAGIAPKDDDDDGNKGSEISISAPQRAQRASRGQEASSEPWQTDGQEPERVTDVAWIEGFRQRVTAATNTRDLQALQGEANGKWGENKLSREDAQALRAEVSERTRELTAGVPA